MERERRSEGDRMKRVWVDFSVVYASQRTRPATVAPVCLFNSDRGLRWRRGGGLFCGKWQNVLIEEKPCLLSSHSDTIKTIRKRKEETARLFCSGAPATFGRVISWDSSTQDISRTAWGRLTTCPAFPGTTSQSSSPGRGSTDTGHCLRWRGSPASSHCWNPLTVCIKWMERESQRQRGNKD